MPFAQNTGRIQYTIPEASPEQVSGPGGVYISPREIVYSTLGAEGAQVVYPSSRGEIYTSPPLAVRTTLNLAGPRFS